MTVKHQSSSKRVFWAFLSLSIVITSGFFVVNFNASSPQADIVAEEKTSEGEAPAIIDLVAMDDARCRGNKIDFAYVVDDSGSMDDHGSDAKLKKFAEMSEPKFRSDDRLALITFHHPIVSDPTQSITYPFTSDFASITSAVKKLQFNGDSSQSLQGIEIAQAHFKDKRRSELIELITPARIATIPGIIILVGENNGGNQTAVNPKVKSIARDLYVNSDVRTYTVSIGQRNRDLEGVSQVAGGKHYVIGDRNSPQEIAAQLFGDINKTFAECYKLNFSADKRVVRLGSSLQFTYEYRNNTREDSNLVLVHPTAGRFAYNSDDNGDAVIESAKTIRLPLGVLKPGESGKKEITVQYQGE